MSNKLYEINLEYFQYDFFKRNDHSKCIEISNSNQCEPVHQFLLYIDHTDCNQQCFVNEKISKTEHQLSDMRKFNIKSDRDKNRYRAIVTAKNIQSVYEIYLQVCLTERCLMLPMNKKIDTKVNLSLCNDRYQYDELNIINILKEDCLLNIFSYFDLNDLFTVASVCTDFRALVQQNKQVKNLKSFHFKFYDKYFETEEGKEIFSDKSVTKMKNILECIGGNLEDVCVSVGRTSNEFRIFETVIRNVGTNLHTLRLRNFCWLSLIIESNTSSEVFQQIKTLHLDSQYYDMPISVDIKTKFPNLEKLELHGRWRIDDFSNWLNIKELTLDRIISLNHSSWMSWMTDVSTNFSNLVALFISNTMKRTVPLENYECLLKLTKLKEIQIEILDRNCFDVLLKMTQLTCVKLIFYNSIQEVIEDNLFQLSCLTNLEKFDMILKAEAFLPRDDLITLISMANHLKSIHLINDTIKVFLFIAPSFLLEILDARKQSQESSFNKTLLQVAFSKCFIDESVFKEAETTFREYILLRNYSRAY